MTTGTETDRSKGPSVGCTSLDLRQSARQYFGTIPQNYTFVYNRSSIWSRLRAFLVRGIQTGAQLYAM